jgi:hypothetical protein
LIRLVKFAKAKSRGNVLLVSVDHIREKWWLWFARAAGRRKGDPEMQRAA